MKTPYHWFDVSTVEKLRDQLAAAGDNPVICVRIEGEGAKAKAFIEAMPRDAKVGPGELNESWPCPPICREG